MIRQHWWKYKLSSVNRQVALSARNLKDAGARQLQLDQLQLDRGRGGLVDAIFVLPWHQKWRAVKAREWTLTLKEERAKNVKKRSKEERKKSISTDLLWAPKADVQPFCDNSPPALPASKPPGHKTDKRAIAVRVLWTWGPAPQNLLASRQRGHLCASRTSTCLRNVCLMLVIDARDGIWRRRFTRAAEVRGNVGWHEVTSLFGLRWTRYQLSYSPFGVWNVCQNVTGRSNAAVILSFLGMTSISGPRTDADYLRRERRPTMRATGMHRLLLALKTMDRLRRPRLHLWMRWRSSVGR